MSHIKVLCIHLISVNRISLILKNGTIFGELASSRFLVCKVEYQNLDCGTFTKKKMPPNKDFSR